MRVLIMGTRGIPADHGGFEACVENIAPFLTSQKIEVHVFRQIDDKSKIILNYKGVKLVNIVTSSKGTMGTIIFDIKSTIYAIKKYKPNDLVLTFGYPTAVLFPFLKIFGFTNIVNMDGIEWKRKQFGFLGKIWYWLNEKVAVLSADVLIADHSKIAVHLNRINFLKRPVYTIAYSADNIRRIDIKIDQLSDELKKIVALGKFMLVMARLEPDNQILEIVKAFSARRRGFNLIIAGRMDLRNNKYHKILVASASEQIKFVGGIYNPVHKIYLRNNSIAYLHGHTVGGTNPSLVEALGSRSIIIAHGNEFNKGVAESGALYFSNEDELKAIIDNFSETELKKSRKIADQVFQKFTHQTINSLYLQIINENVQ